MSVPGIALGQAPFAGVMLRLRLDAAGPPWPLETWNHQTQAWETVGQASAVPASYAALCTGDAAPTLIGTGDGQPVLVPIF